MNVKHLQDLGSLVDKLYDGNHQPVEAEIDIICARAREALSAEANVLAIKSPVVIVGDIHGQFFDLLEVFKIAGKCPLVNYLFMGDYVDRGFNSVKVLSLLLALKARYPGKIWLLRGNHESREINRSFGFYDECMNQYGSPQVWKKFTGLYELLPLAAIVDKDKFCCHGGLSPSFSTVDEIMTFERGPDIPHDGGLCDLMWSDPNAEEESKKDWEVSPRGAGYYFGYQVTESFLHRNKLQCIIRAHQFCPEGCYMTHNNKCITVFSAPNYCLRSGNLGAFIKMLSQNETEIVKFEESIQKTEPKVHQTIPEYFM